MLIVMLVAILDILVPGSPGNDLGRHLNFAQKRHYNFASTCIVNATFKCRITAQVEMSYPEAA